jgi:hypothetical protein
MTESDLYAPLKRMLEGQGFVVKGEVLECDVLAVRGDESPVVVELKRTLNLDVVLQAVARLSLTPKVYIGVPRRSYALRRRGRHVIKLLRMLGLGLVLIDAEGGTRTTVRLDPGAYRPRPSKPRRERLLGEFDTRVGDPNLGGTHRRGGVMTAYRQRALAIAQFLDEHGATKASIVAHALREPRARDILYRDAYGWFERPTTGVYELSPRGRTEHRVWRDRREGTSLTTAPREGDDAGRA